MNEDTDINFYIKEGKMYMVFDLKKKRPLLHDWLVNKVLKDKVDKHYIAYWSRLARNVPLGLGIINLCKQHNTKIIAISDTNDKKMIMFSLMMAQLESDLTKERVDFNKRFKFENGLYMGTKTLKGYKKTRIKIDGREFTHLVPNESEVQMVKDVFKMDYKSFCDKYNVDSSVYYNIKNNKFYCGYISYGGEEKKGIHIPIVTEEEFNC